MWYQARMAPEGVGVLNPAFDVSGHELIKGIITKRAIAASLMNLVLRIGTSVTDRSYPFQQRFSLKVIGLFRFL